MITATIAATAGDRLASTSSLTRVGPAAARVVDDRGGVLERREHVLAFKVGIVGEHLFDGAAAGELPEIPLNPRTHEAIDRALDGRTDGPLLLNRWGNRIRRHNAAAIVTRLARTIGLSRRVTPHALRRSYITIGLLQGVPLREMRNAPATPAPTRPSPTTSPTARFTATRPSSS